MLNCWAFGVAAVDEQAINIAAKISINKLREILWKCDMQNPSREDLANIKGAVR